MSTMRADTRNTYGMRTLRGYQESAIHRAPAEIPPVPALFKTRGLAGVYDDGTQSHTYRLAGLGADPAVTGRGAVYALTSGGGSSGSGVDSSVPLITHFRPPGWSTAPVIVGGVHQAAQPNSSQQSTPTPTTQSTTPTTPAPTLVPAGGTNATAQAGTPVPINWPIAQSYTDSSGNIWAYTAAGGWQITGYAAGSVAEANALAAQMSASAAGGAGTVQPGTTVSVATGFDLSAITTWLQSSTVLFGATIPNIALVGGFGVLALWLYGGSGKKR